MNARPDHTVTAVPPLDGELAGLLDDLAGIHPGIDQIRDGIRLLALDRHTVGKTQTVIAALVAAADGTNLVHAIAQLVARLSTADTNPALRALNDDQQKTVQRHGMTTAHWLADPELTDHAAEIPAAITGT